jgi:hypothetical protein
VYFLHPRAKFTVFEPGPYLCVDVPVEDALVSASTSSGVGGLHAHIVKDVDRGFRVVNERFHTDSVRVFTKHDVHARTEARSGYFLFRGEGNLVGEAVRDRLVGVNELDVRVVVEWRDRVFEGHVGDVDLKVASEAAAEKDVGYLESVHVQDTKVILVCFVAAPQTDRFVCEFQLDETIADRGQREFFPGDDARCALDAVLKITVYEGLLGSRI